MAPGQALIVLAGQLVQRIEKPGVTYRVAEGDPETGYGIITPTGDVMFSTLWSTIWQTIPAVTPGQEKEMTSHTHPRRFRSADLEAARQLSAEEARNIRHGLDDLTPFTPTTATPAVPAAAPAIEEPISDDTLALETGWAIEMATRSLLHTLLATVQGEDSGFTYEDWHEMVALAEEKIGRAPTTVELSRAQHVLATRAEREQ